MIREEYLRRIVDACYVDLYLSATDGARVYWPWRMQPVHEADKRHRMCRDASDATERLVCNFDPKETPRYVDRQSIQQKLGGVASDD